VTAGSDGPLRSSRRVAELARAGEPCFGSNARAVARPERTYRLLAEPIRQDSTRFATAKFHPRPEGREFERALAITAAPGMRSAFPRARTRSRDPDGPRVRARVMPLSRRLHVFCDRGLHRACRCDAHLCRHRPATFNISPATIAEFWKANAGKMGRTSCSIRAVESLGQLSGASLWFVLRDGRDQ
jgi:hypothetical protein